MFPLLKWTIDAKRALKEANKLSSHAANLVRDSTTSLDRADYCIRKCIFLKKTLKAQVNLLEEIVSRYYSVEDHIRRKFEVRDLKF